MHKFWSGGTMNRAINAPTPKQGRVGRVDDRVKR